MAMSETPDTGELFSERAADALTSYMTVLEDLPKVADDPEQFIVVSNSGREYRVDLRAESCTCPDCLHRGHTCKHIYRVRFATGRVPIPGWVNREAIDPQLGLHVSADPRIRTTTGIEVFEDGE
ncbi:SWIM zinc finger family protein [haloarchaeon 3A1-DGR]|nr:SWIM zinc finger family protein [haloarchaeon 3A1-DGR]